MTDDRQHVRELIALKRSRLRLLELRAARYGIDCPPQVVLEMDDLRKEIVALEQVDSIRAAAPIQPDLESASRRKRAADNLFDVFLCHDSHDKSEVKQIGRQLLERSISPWLDEWELRPGLPWQRLLEQQIEQIDSAAVFVGRGGIGPWQQQELEAFLREFVRRGCPVVPVVLPSATHQPELPVFLRGMTWVDFRRTDPDPFDQLIWGITGRRGVRIAR